jgi:hypothetical protein
MATETNTTFVAATGSLLGKELEFITIDAGEELANHLLKKRDSKRNREHSKTVR